MLLLAALVLLVVPAQAPAPAARDDGAVAQRDVVYRTVAGVELHLDALLPPGEGPYPSIMLIHGGAWMHGNKRNMHEFAELLVQQGYACFSIQYRLAPAHRWPAQIEDCLAAVQFVRAEAQRFHADPTRVGALGPSAGGHLAALLGVLDERAEPASPDAVRRQSSRVQCVVNYFGPVLLARKPELDFDTQPPPELFGDAPDTAYAQASPLNFVTPDDAPFLLVHGDADVTVPLGHSLIMDEKLRATGVASELIVIPGGGHGDFFRTDPKGAYWQRTEAFLAAHLKPGVAR